MCAACEIVQRTLCDAIASQLFVEALEGQVIHRPRHPHAPVQWLIPDLVVEQETHVDGLNAMDITVDQTCSAGARGFDSSTGHDFSRETSALMPGR